MTSFGIIFDIDGVVTLPITEERKISLPDPELFSLIKKLSESNVFISFITGRAFLWFKDFILPQIEKNNFKYSCFLEYGLVSYNNNELIVSSSGKAFRRKFFDMFLNKIESKAKELKIYFEKSKFYVDYPKHGSIWVEKKNCMISIIANEKISTAKVHELVEGAIKSDLNEIRFIKHHLGCDILPKGWSKEQGAINVRDLTKDRIDKWYVFGDNESDKEMCKPFSNVEYIDTKFGASKKTISVLIENFPNIIN